MNWEVTGLGSTRLITRLESSELRSIERECRDGAHKEGTQGRSTRREYKDGSTGGNTRKEIQGGITRKKFLELNRGETFRANFVVS